VRATKTAKNQARGVSLSVAHQFLPREAFLPKREKLGKRYFLTPLTAPIMGNYSKNAVAGESPTRSDVALGLP
jgi:glycerol uptake facilitator-like aquaporin